MPRATWSDQPDARSAWWPAADPVFKWDRAGVSCPGRKRRERPGEPPRKLPRERDWGRNGNVVSRNAPADGAGRSPGEGVGVPDPRVYRRRTQSMVSGHDHRRTDRRRRSCRRGDAAASPETGASRRDGRFAHRPGDLRRIQQKRKRTHPEGGDSAERRGAIRDRAGILRSAGPCYERKAGPRNVRRERLATVRGRNLAVQRQQPDEAVRRQGAPSNRSENGSADSEQREYVSGALRGDRGVYRASSECRGKAVRLHGQLPLQRPPAAKRRPHSQSAQLSRRRVPQGPGARESGRRSGQRRHSVKKAIVLVTLAIPSQTSLAARIPQPTATDQRIRQVVYNPSEVYELTGSDRLNT